MEVWKFEEIKQNPKILDLNNCDYLGKTKRIFEKKSKNPWSSREFVKFTFDLSITSVEELNLKKDFGKIQKSISCQGYPWNPWGNFFQLVTVIPWDEHQPFIVKTQRNSTQSNSKSNFVGLDIVLTWNPPHPTHPPRTNFSVTSRPARELKFGTDTH